jgi:hypothetical protein
MLTRRHLLAGAVGAMAASRTFAAAAGGSAGRAPGFDLQPLARVIVDNDFAGDPDGLVALVHQLLAPSTEVRVVSSSFLNPQFPPPPGQTGGSAAAGRALAEETVALLRSVRPPRVVGGAERALVSHDAPQESTAAHAIVAEALRDDPLPLICTCGGPLTNVASALLMEPRIAQRMTVVWIGGGGYPQGGWEYNLASDVRAAQVVFNHSSVPLWQVPLPAYRSCQLSIAEMETQFAAAGPTGRWLLEHFQTMKPDWLKLGGTWPMGDSPLVLATALSSESSERVERPEPRIGDDMVYGERAGARQIRVYGRIDLRLLLGDFLARLQLQALTAR